MKPLQPLSLPKTEIDVQKFLDQSATEQQWPEGLPLTAKNIEEVAKTHDITFSESVYSPLLDADEYDWTGPTNRLNGRTKEGYRGRTQEDKAFHVSRDLTKWHPFCRRAITLYEMYLFGPDCYFTINPILPSKSEEELLSHYDRMLLAESVWEELLAANRGAFSLSELVRRLYRDGEVFIEKVKDVWPWKLRFIDCEEINDTQGGTGDQGIIAEAGDINSVIAYRVIDISTQQEVRLIPAANMIHITCDKDSNEKRGKPRLLSSLEVSRMLEGFTMTEATHRKMQASIVLRRKVEGGGAVAQQVLRNSRTGTNSAGTSYERFGFGTILTEPKGMTTEFVQPKSDFSDASPLARFLLTHVAATTGWSYSMLSQDSSQGNLASEQLAEGPVATMVCYERSKILPYLLDLWKEVLTARASARVLGSDYRGESLWTDYQPYVNFGSEYSREAMKDAQANNMVYMNNAMSAQDICEENGRNWIKTAVRIISERKMGIFPPSYQMPSGQDTANSSKDNATKGSGTNQGQQ